jgi:cytochrome P450
MRDKYLRKDLMVMDGQEWKDARQAISPAFSSGKIKMVMVNCFEEINSTDAR